MSHAWMNVLAAIVISLQGIAVQNTSHPESPLRLETIEVDGGEHADEAVVSAQRQARNYIVVERLSEDLAYLETPRGRLILPAHYLPDAFEGMVIEYRIAWDEAQRRLDAGRDRIERLQKMSAKP